MAHHHPQLEAKSFSHKGCKGRRWAAYLMRAESSVLAGTFSDPLALVAKYPQMPHATVPAAAKRTALLAAMLTTRNATDQKDTTDHCLALFSSTKRQGRSELGEEGRGE